MDLNINLQLQQDMQKKEIAAHIFLWRLYDWTNIVEFIGQNIGEGETHRWQPSVGGARAKGTAWAGSPWWRRWSPSWAPGGRSPSGRCSPGTWWARRRAGACSGRTAARPWSTAGPATSRPVAVVTANDNGVSKITPTSTTWGERRMWCKVTDVTFRE